MLKSVVDMLKQKEAYPMRWFVLLNLFAAFLSAPLLGDAADGPKKKIVIIAGTKSHGYAGHEFNAGCLLLKRALDANVPEIETLVYRGGWPDDPKALEDSDSIVLYMNGGDTHPVNTRLEEVDRLMKKGVGLVGLHYAVEVPKGKPGNYLLDWIGGYFETFWSVNPHWTMKQPQLAKDHPATRGVKPFTINDEWYFHMRFRESMEGVVPILSAIPPESTRKKESSIRGGNPAVFARKGMPEVEAWARERPDGGRGFGFTGGHTHWNWGHDDFRKLVLNAIVWSAGVEVPAGGVSSRTPTLEELEANQDFDPPADFDRESVKRMLAEFQAESQRK